MTLIVGRRAVGDDVARPKALWFMSVPAAQA